MNNRVINYFLLLLLIMLNSSCNQGTDHQAEIKKLMLLHLEQQAAHLDENADQFVDQFADTMYSLNRGIITITGKASALKRFDNYFSKVSFKKWEDVKPPVIELSKDGSMAYMLVDKQVVLTYTNAANKQVEESTHYAWVSIFKKQANAEWKIVCNASTNEPEIKKEY